MSFWGIEVKPGKPYTHKYDNDRGRLRISQATLGNGKSDSGKKSTLQCTVGDKSPVLLCNLLPDKSETCHLELEFEETEEVVFSVVGTRSVHLSGYYLGGGSCRHHHLDGDETDSYGEDIGESDDSGSFSDYDDEYESDLIDDGDDMGMFPRSPKQKSGVVIEEIIDDEKPSNGNANRRRVKKNQVSDSDDGSDGSDGKMVVRHNNSVVIDSEDEDGFPIIFCSKQKHVVKDSEGKSTSKTDTNNDDRKMKIDEISEDRKSDCKASQPSDALLPSEISQEVNEKSAKKKKDAKQEADGTDTDGKSKKKKKKLKEGKIIEGVDVSVKKTEDEAVKDTNEGAAGDKVNQDPPVSGEEEKTPNQSEEVNPSVRSANTEETSGKLRKKNKKKKAKVEKGPDSEGDEAANVNQTDAKKKSEGVEAANVNKTDSKKKKKEKKNSDKDAVANKESGVEGKLETKAGPRIRTYPNGLIVEDLAMGKPDGKRAIPGKKVSGKSSKGGMLASMA